MIVTSVPTNPEVGLSVVILGAEETRLPVPVNGTANMPAVMLFATFTAPALRPLAVGVNVTFIVQLALTASGIEETQLSVSVKSPVEDLSKRKYWIPFARLNSRSVHFSMSIAMSTAIARSPY